MGDYIPVTKSYEPSQDHPYMSGKFKRRDPNDHFYLPIECPDSKYCTDGLCPLAHNKLEVIFHPIVYKTRKCKMSANGSCAFFSKCSFYNNKDERNAARLLWRIWEEKWKYWRSNIEAMLILRNKMNSAIAKKLATVATHRNAECKGKQKTEPPEAEINLVMIPEEFFLWEPGREEYCSESVVYEPFQNYTPIQQEPVTTPCESMLTNSFHQWFDTY